MKGVRDILVEGGGRALRTKQRLIIEDGQAKSEDGKLLNILHLFYNMYGTQMSDAVWLASLHLHLF